MRDDGRARTDQAERSWWDHRAGRIDQRAERASKLDGAVGSGIHVNPSPDMHDLPSLDHERSRDVPLRPASQPGVSEHADAYRRTFCCSRPGPDRWLRLCQLVFVP